MASSAVIYRKINDLRLLLMLHTPVVKWMLLMWYFSFEVFPYTAEISTQNFKDHFLVNNYFIANFY